MNLQQLMNACPNLTVVSVGDKQHNHPHIPAANCHCVKCKPLERPCNCAGCANLTKPGGAA